MNVERQILRVNVLRFFPRVVKSSLRSSIIISSYIHINDGRVFFFPSNDTCTSIRSTYPSSVVITSTVPPRIAPFEMADKAVNWGDSVSGVCTVVNGDSPLEISWALNGMPIDESHRISVTTTKRNSLLSIDSASPSHAGMYTCVASNAAGATSYSAELTVNGTYSRHTRNRYRETLIFIPF